MNITLKQSQIEHALRMYVASEGINLVNRSFDVHFTAGRRGTGLSAEIEIGEAAPAITKPLSDLPTIGCGHTPEPVIVLAQGPVPPAEPVVAPAPVVTDTEPEPSFKPEMTLVSSPAVTTPVSLFA